MNDFPHINYDALPNQGMRNVIHQWIEHGVLFDEFLRGLVTNDLRMSASAADETNRYLLFEWVRWFFNEAPGACWGSPEMVSTWQADRLAARRTEAANG